MPNLKVQYSIYRIISFPKGKVGLIYHRCQDAFVPVQFLQYLWMYLFFFRTLRERMPGFMLRATLSTIDHLHDSCHCFI
jgi:hypothetical protein